MPPPNTLRMRTAPTPGKLAEQVFDKLEVNKLKSPKPLPAPSPFITTDKHINHLVANQHVFDKISHRLNTFSPPIVLGEHIVHSWEKIKTLSEQQYLPVIAHRNTLNGIDFIVEDRQKLLCAIRNARADEGKPGFVEGSKDDWKKHWALALSFKATDGIGFREIFRPKIIERPIANNNKMPFDARFGRDVNVDVSSLHIAVSEFAALNQTRCNVHIDNLTVTMSGIGDAVGLSPSFINHLVNELLFKTNLQGKLPEWIIDAFDISLLNPDEGFLRAGLGATIINKPHFKWTINYSVGLNNNTNVEWSGSFKFEKSFATGLTVVFNAL
jgi:hypothetical protein